MSRLNRIATTTSKPSDRLKPLSWLILHLMDRTQSQIDVLHCYRGKTAAGLPVRTRSFVSYTQTVNESSVLDTGW